MCFGDQGQQDRMTLGDRKCSKQTGSCFSELLDNLCSPLKVTKQNRPDLIPVFISDLFQQAASYTQKNSLEIKSPKKKRG